MQTLKMISSLVFLVGPTRALLRLLAKPLAAIVRGMRPTTALTRACYVLLGIALLLGGLGAEQGGERGWAIALAPAGAILLALRRSAPLVAGPHQVVVPPDFTVPGSSDKPTKTQMPSDLLRSGWTRKGVAVNSCADPVMSDDPSAVAWSLYGAVNAVYEPGSALWQSYMVALQAQVGHNLVQWNGNTDRTQDEVVAAAIEAEKR